MALYLVCFMGGTPFGAPLIGWLAEVAGPRWGLLGGGLVCVLSAVALAAFLARRRAAWPRPRSSSWCSARAHPRGVERRHRATSSRSPTRPTRGWTTSATLTDADVRPDRRGIVIAEGSNVVERLARSPFPMRAVAGVPARIDALRPVLEPIDVAGVLAGQVAAVRRRRVPRHPRGARLGDPAGAARGRRRAGRRAAGRRPRRAQRLREPRRPVPQRGRVRHRRRAARPALRRPAVPAQRAGVDGSRARTCRSPCWPTRGPRRSTSCAGTG